MVNRLGISLAILMMLSSFSATAGDSSVKTMASILSHLNHHPSSAEKKELQKIVNDSHTSQHAHTIAQAMINLDHRISSADRPKLQAIVDDSSATQHERDLAGILLHLNHKPSSADKKKLHAMH